MKTQACPVYSYLAKPSMIDFPGRLAVVLLTSGCNFRCGFCHNAALLQKQNSGFSWQRLDAILDEFKQGWADGAVISGGEPTINHDLPKLIKVLKQRGLAVKLDTNGSRPAMLASVLPAVDYVAMDVKCSLETYPSLTGCSSVTAIQESLSLLKKSQTPYELRTTLIAEIHTARELEKMQPLLQDAARLVLQPFIPRPDLPSPALREQSRTSPAQLQAAAALLRDHVAEIIVRGAGLDGEN